MSMPSRSRTGSGPLVAGLIILVTVVVVVVLLALAGITPQRVWDSFFPVGDATPVTDRAVATRELYNIVFAIGAVIFIIVEGVIVFTVFRYRRKPGDETLPPQIHGNNLVEVIWTAIPTAIVLFLFVMSWQTLNTVEAKAASDVHVRAVASRFQWRFDYLDGPESPDAKVVFSQALPVGADGGLTLPVGEPVTVTLKAEDVIHAFYVPKFLFKRDAVPGKENIFSFTVEEPGTYRGQCAELCGAFHGSMVFEVHALPKADYDTWLNGAIEKAKATPAPAASGAGGPDRRAHREGPRVHHEHPPGTREHGLHDPLRQRGRRRGAQRRDQGRGRQVRLQGRDHHGPGRGRTTRCPRSPPARTRSRARSTRP